MDETTHDRRGERNLADAKYDYIIIGAGSAGSVIANRLTADGKNKVLLLEAGKASHPFSRIPISFGLLINNPAANWCYTSEPEENTDNRRIPVPRGKLLGGSSSINGLVFVRGQPLDYNSWAQFGNRGWAWDDVQPIFRRMEAFEQDGDGVDHRGKDGPLRVSTVPDEMPLYDALFAAAEELGIRNRADYNGADQEGLHKTQVTISNGRRMSTAVCYLDPARGRSNLRIETEAMTHRLIMEGKRCVGVAYRQNGRMVEEHAAREVILCAGGVASPQILELSGIGRPEVLREHGIEVLHEMAAVGENFRDHINARLQYRINDAAASYNSRAMGIRLVGQVLKYGLTRGGLLSLPSGPLVAFLKTRPDMDSPDIQLHLVPYGLRDISKRLFQPFPTMAVGVYQLRPESLGSIHIRSTDPNDQPAIRFNFLADPVDQQVTMDGMRLARKLVGARAMDHLRGEELAPGATMENDADLMSYLRTTCETAYHPIGTCRMSPDGVVDDQLKVHGIDGLRIADASIFPTMPSGNTNAAAIMVGEKASDLILAG
jgi:choline dehydrogenase